MIKFSENVGPIINGFTKHVCDQNFELRSVIILSQNLPVSTHRFNEPIKCYVSIRKYFGTEGVLGSSEANGLLYSMS
jgi:hypothetical protein